MDLLKHEQDLWAFGDQLTLTAGVELFDTNTHQTKPRVTVTVIISGDKDAIHILSIGKHLNSYDSSASTLHVASPETVRTMQSYSANTQSLI